MRGTVQVFHGWLLEATGTALGLVYGSIAALMTLDIGLRALNLGALPWLIELTEYLMYAGTFLAAAWTLRRGAMVRVDILLGMFGPRTARALEIATDVLGAGVSAVILWYGAMALAEAWSTSAAQYKTWVVQEWVLLVPIPLAGLLLLVEFALRALRVPAAFEAQPGAESKTSI